MLRFCSPIIAFLILVSCSTDQVNNEEITLDNTLASKEVVIDNVIACAALNENNDLISVFLFPRPGVTNIQCFETKNSTVDKNDFTNYTPLDLPLIDVFNGFLKKFEVISSKEKWVIVSFDEEGKTHLSSPIRLKQKTKPTEYLPQNVSIDASSNMPIFSWVDGQFDDTKIYFEVLTDSDDNFLSGTYTFEKVFQYYKLENVVLNITKGTPPTLMDNKTYNFSMLAVSEDNWVNLFAEVEFSLE